MRITNEEFKAMRKAAGLRQNEAARLAGTPLKTWSCWESSGKGSRRVPGIALAWLEMYQENLKLKAEVESCEDIIEKLEEVIDDC